MIPCPKQRRSQSSPRPPAACLAPTLPNEFPWVVMVAFAEDLALYYLTLGLGVACVIIALVAAVFGFAGVGGLSREGVRTFLVVFVILAVLAFTRAFFIQRRRQ